MNVKLLREGAQLPYKKREQDAGLDLFAPEEHTIPAWGYKVIPLGIAIELAGFASNVTGIYGHIAPRSSMGAKGIDVYGGVVDENYRGEIQVVLFNGNSEDYKIEKGDKIAQLIPTPILKKVCVDEVEEFDETDRGENGFGSTGR